VLVAWTEIQEEEVSEKNQEEYCSAVDRRMVLKVNIPSTCVLPVTINVTLSLVKRRT